jgi:nucleoside-diphosphate-sugar epimerase
MVDLMTGVFPKVPKVPLPVVDVRNVAEAHVNAIEKGVNGTRYLLNFQDEFPTFLDMGLCLHEEFKDTKYKIPTEEVSYYLFRMITICDSRLKPFVPQWGMKCKVDRSKSIEHLGIVYTPMKKSMVEMAHNLIDLGYMEDHQQKKNKRF